MIKKLFIAASMAVALLASPAFAVEPDEILKDPALEERARELSKEIRCVVCQNQSIDDSNAGLARDLRLLVRERIVAGDTDKEALDYLVARYGEFVLLKPRFSIQNLLLWSGGPIVLLLGAFFIFRNIRNRKYSEEVVVQPTALTEEEKKELDKLINRD